MSIHLEHEENETQTVQSNILKQSEQIIRLAQTEPNSALKCLHLLSVAGGATSKTYQVIAERIMTDNDASGAYHLALMAQSTPDLPIDVRGLITLVLDNGEPKQWLSLLKNLPLPPVEVIQAKILASHDGDSIQSMTAYLSQNPEGYGSRMTPASRQKDRIVPLSENRD